MDPAPLNGVGVSAQVAAGSADTVISWNQLAMDLAIAAARGPTISSRLYALVNTALYDTWSLFDPEAVPSLATGLEQRSLERLLRQPGGGSFRAIAMASAAQQVFSSLAASMLVGPKTALLTSFVERSRVLVEQSLQAAAAAGGSGLSPAAAGCRRN